MGALSRYLGKDAAAKAVLLAILGTSPLPAAADAVRQPAPQTASTSGSTVSEETILVALMGREAALRKVVGMLRDSTDRCLSEQARLLGAVADPSASRTAIVSAADQRRRDLSDPGEDAVTRLADAALRDGAISDDGFETVFRHARLRNACLEWADKSVGYLERSLSDPRARDVGIRIADARRASADDLDRLVSMGPTQDGAGAEVLEGMRTSGPRI
jgi:hypothetical protein